MLFYIFAKCIIKRNKLYTFFLESVATNVINLNLYRPLDHRQRFELIRLNRHYSLGRSGNQFVIIAGHLPARHFDYLSCQTPI